MLKLVRSWDTTIYMFVLLSFFPASIQDHCQMKECGQKEPFVWHGASDTSCLALFYAISCLVLIYIITYMPLAIAVQPLILDLWTSKSSYKFGLNQEHAHTPIFIKLGSIYDKR